MEKEITFKRNNVELAGCMFMIIMFIALIAFMYYVFIYVPKPVNEPYVDPREANK